jgi:CDP-glycerol glycerophosphotransferase (TagB/SpsB family)
MNLMIRHTMSESLAAFSQTLKAMLAWLFAFPLTKIIQRDPRLTLVISRLQGGFADNSKYFFISATQLARHGERVTMLTADRKIQKRINAAGGESVMHPSWRSFWLLLRCGTLVTDWVVPSAYPLTRGAKLVQIWHGAPLKHIELDVNKKRMLDLPIWLQPFLRIQKTVIGRYPVYDMVVATSQKFIADAFQRCFKARRFIATGYPRNDILFGWPEAGSMAHRLSWINVDKPVMERVTAYKSRGHTICLYVPTFRKDLDNPFESELDLVRLSAFARKYHLLIVLKLHPSMRAQYGTKRHPNLIEYSPVKGTLLNAPKNQITAITIYDVK